MVDGPMGMVGGGGGGSTFVKIVAGKCRKLAPSISVEMVRLARPFSSRLSFAAYSKVFNDVSTYEIIWRAPNFHFGAAILFKCHIHIQ
jgi:hypothetical protein